MYRIYIQFIAVPKQIGAFKNQPPFWLHSSSTLQMAPLWLPQNQPSS